MRVNLRSRGRALLMLFLFSEVGSDDAPTQVRIGSHLDVPQFLEAAGDDGVSWMTLCQQVVPASAGRPIELATGSLGECISAIRFSCLRGLLIVALRHGSWLSHRSNPSGRLTWTRRIRLR
jgi:hypothetical protein